MRGDTIVIKSTCLYIIENCKHYRDNIDFDIKDMKKCKFANSCSWMNYQFFYIPGDFSSLYLDVQEELDQHIHLYKFNLIKQISSLQTSSNIKQKEKADALFRNIINPNSNWRYFSLWQYQENLPVRQQIYRWTEVYKHLLTSSFKVVDDYTVIDSLLETECAYELSEKLDSDIDSLSYALYWYSLLTDRIKEYQRVITTEKPRDDWFYLEGGYKVRDMNVGDWVVKQDGEEIPFIKITGEIKRTTGSYGYQSFTLSLYDWNFSIMKVKNFSLTIPKTSVTAFEVDVYGRITSEQVLGIRMYSTE